MAFSDNIWWTKKARIEAEKRLLMYSFQSQVLLLWYSFSGVAASIYHLKNGTSSEEMWVIYSVLTLCISVFISGLSFKERAALIKDSYEALNTLYYKVKSVESERGEEANKRIALLRDEYSQLMGTSENHTDTDFSKAVWLEIFILLKIDRILFKPVRSSFSWKSVVPLIAEWVVAPPNVS